MGLGLDRVRGRRRERELVFVCVCVCVCVCGVIAHIRMMLNFTGKHCKSTQTSVFGASVTICACFWCCLITAHCMQ